jgi:hypothetical protein
MAGSYMQTEKKMNEPALTDSETNVRIKFEWPNGEVAKCRCGRAIASLLCKIAVNCAKGQWLNALAWTLDLHKLILIEYNDVIKGTERGKPLLKLEQGNRTEEEEGSGEQDTERA